MNSSVQHHTLFFFSSKSAFQKHRLTPYSKFINLNLAGINGKVEHLGQKSDSSVLNLKSHTSL